MHLYTVPDVRERGESATTGDADGHRPQRQLGNGQPQPGPARPLLRPQDLAWRAEPQRADVLHAGTPRPHAPEAPGRGLEAQAHANRPCILSQVGSLLHQQNNRFLFVLFK